MVEKRKAKLVNIKFSLLQLLFAIPVRGLLSNNIFSCFSAIVNKSMDCVFCAATNKVPLDAGRHVFVHLGFLDSNFCSSVFSTARLHGVCL